MAETKKTKKPAPKRKPAKKPTNKTSAKAASKPKVSKAVKGAKATKAAKSVKPTPKTSAKRDLARYKKPLLIAAGVLVVIAGAIAANYSNASDEVPPAQQGNASEARAFSDDVIEHIRAGECEQIHNKTSEGFQAVISEEVWLEQCGIASSVLTGEAVATERTDSNAEDDITEFSYTIAASDEQTYIVTTQLVYQSGEWKLQGINSEVKLDTEPEPSTES